MTSKAITITSQSSETTDYVINGAGTKSEDALKSVSIVWNADATGEAPDPLPTRATIATLGSVIVDLQGGGSSATLVISKHDFELLTTALQASPRRLTVTEGATEFTCKKVSESQAALSQIAETPPIS